MSEKIVPPPLPTVKPASLQPPPLPAAGTIPPPLPAKSIQPPTLPDRVPQAAPVAVDASADIHQASTDALFSLPPLASPQIVQPDVETVPQARPAKADPPFELVQLAESSPSPVEANVPKTAQSNRVAWIAGGIVVLALIGFGIYVVAGKKENSATPAKPESVATSVQKVVPENPPVPKTEAQLQPEPQSAPVPAVELAPVPEGKLPPKASTPVPVQRAKTEESSANRLEHLEGAFYLFRNSIQKTSRGYRMAYAVLNSDIAPGSELSGKVKSQVFRVLVNCQNSTWGYDQRYYHARPFGEGDRLDERVWVISEVKFKPIRDSIQDKRMYELMCR